MSVVAMFRNNPKQHGGGHYSAGHRRKSILKTSPSLRENRFRNARASVTAQLFLNVISRSSAREAWVGSGSATASLPVTEREASYVASSHYA